VFSIHLRDHQLDDGKGLGGAGSDCYEICALGQGATRSYLACYGFELNSEDFRDGFQGVDVVHQRSLEVCFALEDYSWITGREEARGCFVFPEVSEVEEGWLSVHFFNGRFHWMAVPLGFSLASDATLLSA